MAEHEQHPANVDPHPPTAPSPEPREETIAKAVGEADAVQEVTPHVKGEDPSTRRGVNRTVTRSALLFAAVGAVVGAVAGLVLSLVPGPLETDGWGATVGYMIVLAGALALVVGVLSTLILLEREDGRIEREVERKTGRTGREPGPGSPSSPEHDLTS
jgi:MFS family permease